MLTLAAGNTLSGIADVASKLTYTIFGKTLVSTTAAYLPLAQGQLPNSAGTLYTAPNPGQAFVKTILVVNTDTVSHTFQLFQGGTAQANAITPTFTLAAGSLGLYEDGDGWQFTNSGGGEIVGAVPAPVNVQTFTTPGSDNWSKPAGVHVRPRRGLRRRRGRWGRRVEHFHDEPHGRLRRGWRRTGREHLPRLGPLEQRAVIGRDGRRQGRRGRHVGARWHRRVGGRQYDVQQRRETPDGIWWRRRSVRRRERGRRRRWCGRRPGGGRRERHDCRGKWRRPGGTFDAERWVWGE
jgi:hypothetical protein